MWLLRHPACSVRTLVTAVLRLQSNKLSSRALFFVSSSLDVEEWEGRLLSVRLKVAGSLGRESEGTMAAVPAAATMATRSTGKLSRNATSSSFLRLIIGRGR